MITAGEVLKRKRETLGKDLAQVSSDTKIQRRFLEYLESDQYERFDSDIFASGFIKIYSKYLGLDAEKLLALYRRSRPQISKKSTKSLHSKPKKKMNIEITSKVVSIITVILFLLGIISYIGFQIYKFQRPPQLYITEPLNNSQVTESKVMVKGMTDINTDIEVNGEPVETDSSGNFEKELELNPGVNTINIKARKESNSLLETTESLRVTYQVENQQQPEEPTAQPQKEENKITLQIVNSSAWVKLDIDDVNQLSQILEPSTEKEYTVQNKFTLITGRVQSTKLLYNGKDVPLSSPQGTGVTQITCQVSQNDIECK